MDFVKNHSYENIDYATAHIWIENCRFTGPKFDRMKIRTYYNQVKKALKLILNRAMLAL